MRKKESRFINGGEKSQCGKEKWHICTLEKSASEEKGNTEEKRLLSAGQDWISLDTISGSGRRGHTQEYVLLYSDVGVWAANCIRAVERDMRGDLGAGDQRGRRQELAAGEARRKLCPPAKFKWPPSWTKGQ